MSSSLWTEKYRPRLLEDYVWRDFAMKQKCLEWIDEGVVPHLILSGKPGTGKSSLARLILSLLGVPEDDILYINASRERKVDDLQDRILNFVQSYPMLDNRLGIKYVFMDEADSMSLLAQKFLRAEIDTYAASVRFIFTCNYVEKILPPIASRCQHFHFEALDTEDFIIRISTILAQEGIDFRDDDLVEFIEASYPDLRKCINLIQQSSCDGHLNPLKKGDNSTDENWLHAISLFEKGEIAQARKMIIANTSADEYPDVYRFLYRNVELFGDTIDQQDSALIIIRDALYRDNFMVDKEINLSATIAELAALKRK